LLEGVAARLAPGGRIVVAYTSRRSWHGPAYALRRRLGRDSVEYAPVPEANLIGPYKPLSPGEFARLVRRAGLKQVAETRLFPLPDMQALRPKIDRAGGAVRILGRLAAGVVALVRPFAPLLRPFARVRIARLETAPGADRR
jgi:hypothetical protein